MGHLVQNARCLRRRRGNGGLCVGVGSFDSVLTAGSCRCVAQVYSTSAAVGRAKNRNIHNHSNKTGTDQVCSVSRLTFNITNVCFGRIPASAGAAEV